MASGDFMRGFIGADPNQEQQRSNSEYSYHQTPPMQTGPSDNSNNPLKISYSRSGGVEDAERMLAESTAQNQRLSDLGNRRAQLDIFDRPGHEALDREETQMFRDFWGPNAGVRSSYAPGEPAPGSQTRSPQIDRTGWNTDGYATPNYTADNFGNAPAGWDSKKWSDPKHQTPKYVVGRILTQAGDLRDPNKRNEAIANIQKAYPGAQFNGKDKISIDGGRSWVDIFGGASAGIYSPAWQDESSQGGIGGGVTSMNKGSLLQSLVNKYDIAGGEPTTAPTMDRFNNQSNNLDQNTDLVNLLLNRTQEYGR
jgi:hypothetical protein